MFLASWTAQSTPRFSSEHHDYAKGCLDQFEVYLHIMTHIRQTDLGQLHKPEQV